MSYVQSYVSSIAFPEKLENAWRMEGVTDIDLLLDFDPNDDIWWTAPRWVQSGDLVFFYHTKSAKQQTKKIRNEAEQTYGLTRQEELYISQLLESAVDQANQYSGTIFGCAASSISSEYVEEHAGHFKTPFSAQMRNIHIFESPLAYDDFKDSVQISQGPIKRLHKPQFEAIKTLLKEQNELPNFLNNAEAAETDFPGVNQDNWPSISCVGSRRFIDESHLRLCLLDWLLEEIKDSGTPVLKECRCLYRGKWRKKSDYFVKVHGNWIPVEAKLNVLSELKLLNQVAQYTRAQSFKPTQGDHRGKSFERKTKFRPDICLIVDQSGVYLASSKRFLGCAAGEPVWRREELSHATVQAIRDRIKEHLTSGTD